MAVTIYYKPVDGPDIDARLAALDAELLPDTIPQPSVSDRPCVVLWSDVLGRGDIVNDDGTLTAADLTTAAIYVEDSVADQTASDITTLLQMRDTNTAYLAISSPTTTQMRTQLRAITEMAQAFIDLQLAAAV